MSNNSQHSMSSLLAVCAGGAGGGRANWNRLIDLISPAVRGGVLGALALCSARREPDLVDDLMQEVWCRLLDRGRKVLSSYRGSDDREAMVFVRRVAAHVAIDRLRANGASKRRPRSLLPLELFESEAPTADHSQCPERRLLAREQVNEIFSLWRQLLGPRTRRPGMRIAAWAWVDGLSTREISERLGPGWNESRIDALLFRLRRRLRAHGVDLPPRSCERSLPPPVRRRARPDRPLD